MGCFLISSYVLLSVFKEESQQKYHLEDNISLQKMWSTFTIQRSIISKIPYVFLFTTQLLSSAYLLSRQGQWEGSCRTVYPPMVKITLPGWQSCLQLKTIKSTVGSLLPEFCKAKTSGSGRGWHSSPQSNFSVVLFHFVSLLYLPSKEFF